MRPGTRRTRDGGVARGGALAQGLRSSAPSRFLVAHPDVAAALLFALFVLAYLWPVLVGGRYLTPNAMLYGFVPWQGLAPPDLAGYVNPLLSDVPFADYPWRYLIREMLHEGTFPSWNPFVFAGTPLWSNPQTGLFSLFSLPLWILPLDYGIGVGAAWKLWAGGFGSYLLVRRLGLGFLPGMLAGVCFSFSAINIMWLTHETLPAVAVMLPWMVWLVERIFQGGRRGCLVGLALVTAIGLGGGHPGMQVHLLAAGGMYGLLRAGFMAVDAGLVGRAAWRVRLLPLAVAFAGIALGTMLMGFMLVPEALSSRDTIGTIARSHGSGTLPGTEMPLTTIRTVLFPDWWGEPSRFEDGGPGTELAPGVFIRVNYNERTMYAGAVGLLLALVAVAGRGGWRRKGPFAVLAFLGLAIPLHFPGLYQLVTHLPAFELVQNQRLHFVWAMAVAVLAAFGLQAVLERPAGDRRRLGVVAGSLVLAGVAFAGAGATGTDVSDTISHFLSGANFESVGVLALTSAGWYVIFALGVALALLAARRWPARAGVAAAAVLALAVVDMQHFAAGYQPMPPADKAIPPRTGAIEFLQRRRDEGRIVGIGYALPNDWALRYGLHDIRGYDPPQPSLRFFELWKMAEPGQLNWTPFSMESISQESMQVASVLGARWVVTEPGVMLPREAGPAVRALRLAYDGEDARVFENPRAVPRVMVASSVRAVDGEDEARAMVVDASFEPGSEAVVEDDALTWLRPGDAASRETFGAGAISLVESSPSGLNIDLELDRQALVVLSDGWSHGWDATVDGRPVDAVRVNDVMRGVIVEHGTHAVAWKYRVPGLGLGALLTGVAVLIALTIGVTHRRARDAFRR